LDAASPRTISPAAALLVCEESSCRKHAFDAQFFWAEMDADEVELVRRNT
jgi:hypothetical protein